MKMILSVVATVLLLVRKGLITWPEALECMKFYLNGYGNRRLFATLPRSGYNWAWLMMSVAKDIAMGGEGDYEYVKEATDWSARRKLVTPFDWRTPIQKRHYGSLPKMVIFHTNQPYTNVVHLQKEKMKVAVLVRNLFDHLQSYLPISGYDASTQDAFIRAGLVHRAIDFCNSWGAFLEKHPNSRLLQYEELVENPVGVIVGLSDFWELELPRDCISKAVELCSRERMLQRAAEHVKSNPRVSPPRGHGSVFTHKNLGFIRKQIKLLLRYDFGYDYEADSASHEPAR